MRNGNPTPTVAPRARAPAARGIDDGRVTIVGGSTIPVEVARYTTRENIQIQAHIRMIDEPGVGDSSASSDSSGTRRTYAEVRTPNPIVIAPRATSTGPPMRAARARKIPLSGRSEYTRCFPRRTLNTDDSFKRW